MNKHQRSEVKLSINAFKFCSLLFAFPFDARIVSEQFVQLADLFVLLQRVIIASILVVDVHNWQFLCAVTTKLRNCFNADKHNVPSLAEDGVTILFVHDVDRNPRHEIWTFVHLFGFQQALQRNDVCTAFVCA